MILSMEKTMVTKVISELKSFSRLKIFPETGPWFTIAPTFLAVDYPVIIVIHHVYLCTVNTFPPQSWWEERIDCTQQLVVSDDALWYASSKQPPIGF